MARRQAATAEQSKEAKKTPRDRFLELAPKRTKQALHALRVLGNCAGAGYEFSSEEAEKIVAAVEQRAAEVRTKFLAPKSEGADRDAFSF